LKKASRFRHLIGDAAKISAYRSGLIPNERQIRSPLKRIELAEAMADFHLKPSDVVLDLCCGSGLPGQIIAKKVSRVIGVDIDPSQIADAGWHRRHSRVGRRIDLLHANAEQLPLADGTVDACFSLCAIEHVADADQMCREVNRVLKPGGVFLLTADSLASTSGSFPRDRHSSMYAVNTYYSTSSLAAILQRNGFLIESCRAILRSSMAVEELLASMDTDRGIGQLASERIRRRLQTAEGNSFGDIGLFVLAAGRKAL
jgi:ubiquinone/menaquinone biosynthesis C-methylase UbiE